MRRKMVIAAAAAFSLGAAVLCATTVLAEAFAARPHALVSRWSHGETVAAHVLNEDMLGRLRIARVLRPTHAQYRLDIGRYYAWRASTQPPGDGQQRELAGLALDAFQQAIGHRPGWGYAWALAAEQRVALGLDSAYTLEMLRRAERLAPREALTQLKILSVGMGYWDEADAEHRATMFASLLRLLVEPNHALAAARIAKHHGRLDLVRFKDQLLQTMPEYQQLLAGS